MSEQKRTKKHFSASEKKAHLAAWQASGLSRLKYSQTHGLSDKTFSRWTREMETPTHQSQKKLVSSMPISLLPVKTMPSKPIAPSINKKQSVLDIGLPNGINIRCNAIDDLGRMLILIKELMLCK